MLRWLRIARPPPPREPTGDLAGFPARMARLSSQWAKSGRGRRSAEVWCHHPNSPWDSFTGRCMVGVNGPVVSLDLGPRVRRKRLAQTARRPASSQSDFPRRRDRLAARGPRLVESPRSPNQAISFEIHAALSRMAGGGVESTSLWKTETHFFFGLLRSWPALPSATASPL